MSFSAWWPYLELSRRRSTSGVDERYCSCIQEKHDQKGRPATDLAMISGLSDREHMVVKDKVDDKIPS
jgi:hypothetical protein